MTMTVREMAAWLAAFPDQDAVVEVLHHDSSPGAGGWYSQGGVTNQVAFDPEVHTEYTDLRGNQFIRPTDPHYGRRTLLIGLND